MSNEVSQLLIYNLANYESVIFFETSDGTPHILKDHAPPKKNTPYELSEVLEGLTDGDTFHVGVGTGRGSSKWDFDTTVTYKKGVEVTAKFEISGTARAPFIKFTGTDSIVRALPK
ncbi:hypothetical protein GYMLUDRAFT_251861 [Collybiopsis luxurians FD-317 M1]|uniref:Uncharacterized protein n=1 Tax=Collybiopsis luxurians FD-317 M1 TaxID=944289 RepID=A0A0D0C1L0_9AGAR|nr:hypothetical protein GYMLUDRAFT_251861 [Collybiopsis luxurians FD-317 M1]